MKKFTAALAVFISLACLSHARLDETEAQSQARYGAPVEGLIGKEDKPLLPGSKESVYNFEGWRVRAAFVGGKTVRIEYVKIPGENGLKKITLAEAEAVLNAERQNPNQRWREEKPRTGNDALNKIKSTFDKEWTRSDRAAARLRLELLLTLETREADDLERKLAKQLPKNAPQTPVNVPKF